MSKNLKIILQNLISRSQSKPHHQADLMAALQTPTLTPEDWRAAFDAQGATLALDQNIHSSPMVRLLTLQALILPETLPRFVTWMLADPSGPQNQNSQRLSLEFQSSLVAAWIPTHQETLQPALTAGIARLLEKVVQKTWPPESLLWLLASPQSLWRFAELAQHLHQDLYTLTTTPPTLTDSPASPLVYAGALWRPLQAWLPNQTAPRPQRYEALAQLCEQISLAWKTSHPTEASRLLTLAIYFHQVSSGGVAPSLMAKAQLPDHQRQHLYGVDLYNPPSPSPPPPPPPSAPSSPPLTSSGYPPPSIDECLQRGWQLYFKAPYAFSGFTLLVGVLSFSDLLISELVVENSGLIVWSGIFQYAVLPVMGVGNLNVALKLSQNFPIRFADFFGGFQRYFQVLLVYWGSLILICLRPLLAILATGVIGVMVENATGDVATSIILILLLAVFGWLIVSLVKTLRLGICYLFAQMLVLDQKLAFWTALKTSHEAIFPHWLHYLALILILGMTNMLGFLALGIGILITLPATMCVFVAAYRSTFDSQSSLSKST